MTTTRIASVHAIFGIDTIESAIAAMAGEHAADFDLEAAADGYRDFLTDYLPASLVVVGNDVMGEIDDVQALAGDGPIEQIREAIQDDMAGDDAFDLTPYAITGEHVVILGEDPGVNEAPTGTDDSDGTKAAGRAKLASDLRRIARLAESGLLDGSAHDLSFHVENAASVQAVIDALGGQPRRYRSSTNTVQAHAAGALVGSVKVVPIVNTDTPWGEGANSDGAWAALVNPYDDASESAPAR
jgi:hypothetical protein